MSVSDDLVRARALIADPACWTRGASARDESGREVDPDDPSACRWCALGAVVAVVPPRPGRRPHELLPHLARVLPLTSRPDDPPLPLASVVDRSTTARQVADVNDVMGHATTLAMFDRAIAAAEREGL